MLIKKYELLIAFRYLQTKSKERFISIVNVFAFLGIGLGVATLIIVMSVMNGYEVEFIKKVLGFNGHITISQSKIDDYHVLIDTIVKVDNVKAAIPLVAGQVMAVSQNLSTGLLVKGISKEDITTNMTDILKQGSFDDYQDGILIGLHLAQHFGLYIGDSLKLIAPKTSNTPFGLIPRMKTFKIIGIFDLGAYEYNMSTVFMSLKSAQTFFELYNSVNNIELILKNPSAIESVKSSLSHIVSEKMLITDWIMANQSLMSALKIERTVMFFILSLIILIAAFNIISSLIMLVQDKYKSIAILRTIGIPRNSIVKIFIISGFSIGFIGTILGLILGVLFSLNIEEIRIFLESLLGITLFDPVIYFLTNLPSELAIPDVVLIVIISLILSFLATIYPAFKAASLMPGQLLKYE